MVIGIPIYKKKLNEFEQISLQQLSRVLWKYPKKFIAPGSLDFDYGPEYSNWEIERFSDGFFKNTDTYSATPLPEVTITAERPQWAKDKMQFEKEYRYDSGDGDSVAFCYGGLLVIIAVACLIMFV